MNSKFQIFGEKNYFFFDSRYLYSTSIFFFETDFKMQVLLSWSSLGKSFLASERTFGHHQPYTEGPQLTRFHFFREINFTKFFREIDLYDRINIVFR